MNKIFTINILKNEVKKVKNKNLKIVHCHGVFDLIHIGHIKHLQSAKNEGDFLVVSLTSDKFVNKGPNRPVNNHYFRAPTFRRLLSSFLFFFTKIPKSFVQILKSRSWLHEII